MSCDHARYRGAAASCTGPSSYHFEAEPHSVSPFSSFTTRSEETEEKKSEQEERREEREDRRSESDNKGSESDESLEAASAVMQTAGMSDESPGRSCDVPRQLREAAWLPQSSLTFQPLQGQAGPAEAAGAASSAGAGSLGSPAASAEVEQSVMTVRVMR